MELVNKLAQRVGGIAHNPDASNPPFLRHRLTETTQPVEIEIGPLLAAVVVDSDFSMALLSLKFEADYIRGLNPTQEYKELAQETELPDRVLEDERQISQQFPELQQFSDEEVLTACYELGIPYAILAFAEVHQTEEEIALLYHPPFVSPTHALRMIQILARESRSINE